MKSITAPLGLLLLIIDAAEASPLSIKRSGASSLSLLRKPSLLSSSHSIRRTAPRGPPLGWNLQHSLSSVRGGGTYDSDSDSSDVSEEEEYDSEEDDLSDDELSNLEIDLDDESEDESESESEAEEAIEAIEAEEEEDEEDQSSSSSSPSSSVGPPVKLTIKTALQSSLVDQHLEFTASRKRTILSLKQAISKTMRGRPPLSCIQLKYHGRTLDEEETVHDLLEEMDDDDDDEEDDNEEESDIGEEDTEKLSLTCDIIPPIDAKFGIEFREKIGKMSTKEIMEAYCVNMAGMVYGQELQAREGELFEMADGEVDGDCEGGELLGAESYKTTTTENQSFAIRKKAALIQKQFESTLSSETLQLMNEEHERVKNGDNGDTAAAENAQEVVYGLGKSGTAAATQNGRKGRTLKGGATMNIKRSLQRNLNVNWADTTRNSLLFLFFGYFGGRNSFSRTFLLLSSPLCFLLQTRPVKVAMKQLFYTMGEPPGIFLSLLPAPQQVIMSLDYGGVMRGLYGEKVLVGGGGEEWLEMERMEESGGLRMGSEMGLDEDYEDQYDDDDSEEEY